MSSQEQFSGIGTRPDGKVPICKQHKLPMRRYTVRKESPNKGRCFWQCQQQDQCKGSFLWDDDIDSKPTAWAIENLVTVSDDGKMQADARRPQVKHSVITSLANPTHFEVKFMPAIIDSEHASFMSTFSSTQDGSWVIPLSQYYEFTGSIESRLPNISMNIVPLPEWVMDRYLKQQGMRKSNGFKISKISPSLWEQLLDFQKKGVEQVVSAFDGRCLIADEMGLGKTVQALTLASYYSEDWPVLVITPSSLRFHWRDSILRWLPDLGDQRVKIVESGRDWPKNARQTDVIIISYSLLHKLESDIEQLHPNFIIADESHYIKNPAAQRTKATVPILQRASRAVLLTGTPLMARPSEIFMQAHSIRPDVFGNYRQFGVRYCEGHMTQYGWECRGKDNLKELNAVLSDTLMVRRLKKDVLRDLPPKFRSGITVTSLSAHDAASFKQRLDAVKDIDDEESMNHGALAELYHSTGLAKVSDGAKLVLLKMESSDDEKFLVFAHHQDVLDGIETQVRRAVPNANTVIKRIDGSTSQITRREIVMQFQTCAECRILLLSIKAASVGLTLTAASNVIFAELSWTPQDLLQAEDRAHRIGQEGSCVNISYLLAKGTLDDIMWPLLQRKLSVCNEAVDAGKGNSMRVQFDRVADNVVSPNAKRRKVPESLPVKVGPMDRYVLCRPRFSSPVKRSESIIDDMHPASQSPRSDGRIVIRETRPHDSSPRMSGNRPRTPSGKTGPALVVLSDTDNQIIDLTQ